jgi:hypothetical protein
LDFIFLGGDGEFFLRGEIFFLDGVISLNLTDFAGVVFSLLLLLRGDTLLSSPILFNRIFPILLLLSINPASALFNASQNSA